MFNAFNATPLADVRVVILGQDPYHGPGQAHGLCFSVRRGVPPPPSLKNIYKELATDIPGFVKPDHGNLQSWAEQGVFLLNASLSVRQGKANSRKLGWQEFTDEVIKVLNRQPQKIVFVLWGDAEETAASTSRALRPPGGAPVAALGDQVPRLQGLLARQRLPRQGGKRRSTGACRRRRE